MASDKIVGEVFTTCDYDKFKRLSGNRDCTKARKNKLIKSFEEIGWIRNPIVINPNFEVIDGQGRLEACRELGMPVEYVIDERAGLKECQTLNRWQTNWRPIDYCKSFAEEGKQDYQRLLDCLEAFESVTLQTLCIIILNRVLNGGGSTTVLKSGELCFTEKRKQEIIPSLAVLDKNNQAISAIKGQRRIIQPAIAWIINNTNCNVARLEKIVNEKYVVFPPAVEAIQFLAGISDIYNKGLKAENCIYFDTEYKKALKETTV